MGTACMSVCGYMYRGVVCMYVCMYVHAQIQDTTDMLPHLARICANACITACKSVSAAGCRDGGRDVVDRLQLATRRARWWLVEWLMAVEEEEEVVLVLVAGRSLMPEM